MARKSPKCPPTVEPSQFGCVWNFSGMFARHHRHQSNRKLLPNDSHGSKTLQGAEYTRSQVQMINFDEQIRSINIRSKKKSMKRSVEGKVCSSKHTRNNDTMEISFLKKIKSRYENPSKKKNPSLVDKIVVLKPVPRAVECPVDVGCRFSYHPSSISKQQIVKNSHFSLNDVTKKLKNSKKTKITQKTRSFEDFKDGSKSDKLSIVSFSKQRDPDVFVEARRHLAERLRLVAKGESNQQAARTLERILLLSPVHGSMAAFSLEPEGSRAPNVKTWSSLSPLSRTDGSSSSGSDPNKIDAPGGDGCCIEGLQMEISLDVSSPKSDQICKSKAMDNDQFRENPSPVSVLESFFADNLSSPTSTIESVEHHIQPNRLDFDESVNTPIEDRGFISAYINAVYKGSLSNWEGFLSFESSCNHKLLRDCVEEVLGGLHLPWISFFDSKIRAFSLEKDVVEEVMERVDWHNGKPVGPRTLDQLVGIDIMKSGKWVDVKLNGNEIVFEVVDDMLQELIVEAIFDILV